MNTQTAVKPYANMHGWTDVDPYEVVQIVSEKLVRIRAMSSVLDPTWSPKRVPGGFSAVCVNQADQKWIITSDPTAQVVNIRKHKSGKWKDRGGNEYAMSDSPRRFYDYNF